MKTTLWLAPLKLLLLTGLLFACFAIAAGIVGPLGGPPAPAQEGGVALVLLICLLDTAVLSYLVMRSQWAGWRLAVSIFVVFYGVTTVMSQIETAVFLPHLPAGVLPRLFALGALVAAPFAVLAVVVLGKGRARRAGAAPGHRLAMPARGWAWKLAVIGLAYVLIYFSFGYFIAWRNPAVHTFYGGVDEGAFIAQMKTVLVRTPWLVALQLGRAVLWTALAVPIVRMIGGARWESALAVGLVFAVLMNAQLLLPNPFMPEAVRMVHLLETASSNFLFGVLVGWMLASAPRCRPPGNPALVMQDAGSTIVQLPSHEETRKHDEHAHQVLA